MSASMNDKLTQIMNGGNPTVTTVTTARAIGGTTLACTSLANWSLTTAVYFVTYSKNTDGTINPDTICSWKGIVVSNNIENIMLENGIDAGNAIGDYVESGPTAAWAEGIYEWGTKEHNTDGTHSAITSTSVTTDTLTASGLVTANNGLTVSGTLTIPDASITAAKVDFPTFNWSNSRSGTVNTSSTGSFTFTALNGGLTLTFPAVSGNKYEICISAAYVSPGSNMQFDIAAQIAGSTIIDLVCTNSGTGTLGIPMMGRTEWPAASTGNITITCGVLSSGATTMRTDNFTVSVRQAN